MKFVTIRDFRSRSSEIQKELPEEGEMVLTSNGRPIAIISSVTEKNLEEILSAFRRARAIGAVTAMQLRSSREGRDKIGPAGIDKEIETVRKSRKAR